MGSVLTVSHLKGQTPHTKKPTAIRTQLGLTQFTGGTFLKHLALVIGGNALLGPKEHLPHKATIPRLGDVADLLNAGKKYTGRQPEWGDEVLCSK